MLVECPQCHIPRELVRDRGSICQKCGTAKNIKTPEGGHKRVCLDCGEVKHEKNRSYARRCKSCSVKARSKKVTVFKATCPDCLVTRTLTTKPVSEHLKCRPCAGRTANKLTREQQIQRNISKNNRHFRTCPKCFELGLDTAIKEVPYKGESGSRLCRLHFVRSKGLTYKKAVKKEVSTEAIERARELNRIHRADVSTEKNKRCKAKTETQMRDMIDSYYKKNKVVHVDCKETYGMSTLTMNL